MVAAILMNNLHVSSRGRRGAAVFLLATTVLLSFPAASLADVLYLDAPWLRLGVDPGTGLPNCLGIGVGGGRNASPGTSCQPTHLR